MDKYPMLVGGQAAGELTVQTESLYTVFDASVPLRDGLWCVWAVGEQGTLRIGIPEPAGDRLRIRRRFSQQLTAPLGNLLRGELRSLAEEREQWAPPEAAQLNAYLRQRLRGIGGVLTCCQGSLRLIAIPQNDAAPFPLESMFCFARLRPVKGRACWVFAFDDHGWPQMP